ncbi:hypothetical protein P3S67_006939 [Capsicum chacoense]
MLAKAIAKESGAVCINVRISNLMSKWFGDAQKMGPAIIFIDEVDCFLGERKTTDNDTLTSMKTEFMALWDGFSTNQNARVMVLAATNRPSELDEAILRHLPQAFEIGMPDNRERSQILNVILRGEKVEDNIDYDRIASLCDGYTGSDLLELCKKAACYVKKLPTFLSATCLMMRRAEGELLEPRPLSELDLEKVLATSKKTKVAAREYSRLSSRHSDSDSSPVQVSINQLSKLVVSRILNLNLDNQDS